MIIGLLTMAISGTLVYWLVSPPAASRHVEEDPVSPEIVSYPANAMQNDLVFLPYHLLRNPAKSMAKTNE